MRPEKTAIMQEIRSQVEGSGYVILADCRGLKSEQMNDLRGQLRGSKAALKVVPNALFGVAVKQLGYKGLEPFLTGPTAIVVGKGDITQVAKTIKVFVKASNNMPVLKGGYLSGRALTAAEVQSLADMPAREILLAMVVGTIAAPMSQLVGVMHQKLASLVYALKAVAEKKGTGNESMPEKA